MVKNFDLYIPRRQIILSKEQNPSYPSAAPPSVEVEKIPPIKFRHAYNPFPSVRPNSVLFSHYTQHRQQDWGRAIALDLDEQVTLIRRPPVWEFYEYINSYQPKGKDASSKLITFSWDGTGSPVDIPYENGYTRVTGYPHKYQWTAWFLINGIPDNTFWPPLPSKSVSWSFPPPWQEYTQ